jgi:hypothetical protein
MEGDDALRKAMRDVQGYLLDLEGHDGCVEEPEERAELLRRLRDCIDGQLSAIEDEKENDT